MLLFDPRVIDLIASEHGWLHTKGRLAGTVNASKMAEGLGVAKTTITRAYDGGSAGIVLLERLREVSGMPLDSLVMKKAS